MKAKKLGTDRDTIRIGVISDTHGLLRPEAISALQGSDRIFHAGDIGDREILGRLAEIAPVTVIRGNVDRAAWCRALPETEAVEVGDIWIYMLHDISKLDLKPAPEFKVVIYGHSHIPKQETKNGVLFFNPGSAGPRRFKLPVTVGRITVKNGLVQAEIVRILD